MPKSSWCACSIPAVIGIYHSAGYLALSPLHLFGLNNAINILGNFTILYCWIPSLHIDTIYCIELDQSGKTIHSNVKLICICAGLKKDVFLFYFSEGVQSKSEKVAISFDSFAMGWLR